MRILVGVAVAALMLATPAVAQTGAPAAQSACAPIAPAPADLPDGARATRRQMEAANQRVTEWATAANASLQCRRAEAEAQRAIADALGAEFNSNADAVRTAIAAWEAEAAEFNARGVGRESRGTQEQPQMPQPPPPPSQ